MKKCISVERDAFSKITCNQTITLDDSLLLLLIFLKQLKNKLKIIISHRFWK
jgi:hypothetical protein